jgi:hypothetical protein
MAKTRSGRTAPGAGWQPYPGGAGIFIQVNTEDADFDETPTYVTSIGGNSSHWATTGGNAVYPPDRALSGDLRRGFRIYIRWANGAPLDPTLAAAYGWHINWIGRTED